MIKAYLSYRLSTFPPFLSVFLSFNPRCWIFHFLLLLLLFSPSFPLPSFSPSSLPPSLTQTLYTNCSTRHYLHSDILAPRPSYCPGCSLSLACRYDSVVLLSLFPSLGFSLPVCSSLPCVSLLVSMFLIASVVYCVSFTLFLFAFHCLSFTLFLIVFHCLSDSPGPFLTLLSVSFSLTL